MRSKFLCGAGVVDEGGGFPEKHMKGMGSLVKACSQEVGVTHRKLLKCMGVCTFSKMKLEHPVLSGSHCD